MISLLIAIIYLCFISLGLPDSLLGSAWPTIYQDYNIPISYQGLVSIVISASTIFSSLMSDNLTKKFSPFKVIVVSILLTSIGLFGFSISKSFYMLILFSIPYGLGGGSIDACLNNYVSLHFKSKHMSWLHCMWGLGASISPYIMGYAINYKNDWHKGYLIVSIIQIIITFIVLISFPLWKRDDKENVTINPKENNISFKDIINTKGAIFCFLMFFSYCSFESSTFHWASSYINLHLSISKGDAANLAFLFYGGLTLGRLISGFIASKLKDIKLILIGIITIIIGLIFIFIDYKYLIFIGLAILGMGAAPIYPSIIHMTPSIFGVNKSQKMIGIEMAFAYTGSALMPPLFGLIANNISISLFPLYISIFIFIMILFYLLLVNTIKNKKII